MNPLLFRDRYTEDSTVGVLSIDGKFECYTLEDRVRATKVMGETCIPAGKYQIIRLYSESRGKFVPVLLKVPNFSGILIHSGNTKVDTKGCILVGQLRYKNKILSSRLAYGSLWKKLEAAWDAGEEVWIEVKNIETDPDYIRLSA